MNSNGITNGGIKREINVRSASARRAARPFDDDPSPDEIAGHHADGRRCYATALGELGTRCGVVATQITQHCRLRCTDSFPMLR